MRLLRHFSGVAEDFAGGTVAGVSGAAGVFGNGRGGLVQGEFEREGVLADGAFDADTSLMSFDHFAGKHKAESRTTLSGFVAGFGREEAVEDFFELIGWNPGAGVFHDDFRDGCLGWFLTWTVSRPPGDIACRALMMRFIKTC